MLFVTFMADPSVRNVWSLPKSPFVPFKQVELRLFKKKCMG